MSDTSLSALERINAACDRFVAAWPTRPRPRVADFLDEVPEEDRSELRDALLGEAVFRVKADQRRRWGQGERVAVEEYLREDPALREEAERVLELVAHEVALRRQRDEAPRAEEYLALVPGHEAELRRRFAGGQEVIPPTVDEPRAPDTMRPGTVAETLPADGRPGEPVLPEQERYLLRAFLGGGGMGEVFWVHDAHMARDLALKVLRPEYRGQPLLVRRFLKEARVHSRLQHPGFAPVHDAHMARDGRPYFTMKLVRGRTLADRLKERTHPAQELARFVAVFEQICQALAYAHAQGVLHRDLKPANVMVGEFGEVQVMDLGLAKVLVPGVKAEAAPPAVPETVGTAPGTEGSTGEETRPGQAMGTPAYMPPEQARGEVGRVDRRSDVFGLGAILCEVLTGHPPFGGNGPEEVWARARACDHAEALARLDGCGADAALARLCKDCLAAEPAGRPGDAGAVGRAVAAYQAEVQERLRRAELEKAAAEARAAGERKRRRLAVALAAVVLAAVVSLAGGGLWQMRQRAERQAEAARQAEALRQEVGAVLGQAARFRRAGHFGEVLELLEQAQKRLGADGPVDLRVQVDRAVADTRLAKRLDDARMRASTSVEGKLDIAGMAQECAAALREAGLGQEGEDAGEVGARVRASAVRAEVVAALDDWAGLAGAGPRREWLLAVARAADPDPVRDRLRQPALWRDKEALAREARGTQLSPQLAVALSRALPRSGGSRVALLREAQARHPDDFWLNVHLGGALGEAKEWDEASRFLQAALALRPWAALVHNDLGIVLYRQGKKEEAIRHWEEALRLDPQHAKVHTNLGNALRDRGQVEEAIRHHEEAVRLDPNDAEAHNGLGVALGDKGRLEDAIRHHEQALDLDPKLAEAHNNLGIALNKKGCADESIRHYEEALRLDPKLAEAHNNLGTALKDKGRLGEGIRHFEEAIRLNPKLAKAHHNLGAALRDQGQVDEAIRHFEEAIRLNPKYAEAHNGLGVALGDKGRLDEAIRHHEQALRIDPKLAEAHNNLGRALYIQGKLDGAIRHFEAALVLDPKHAVAHNNLGTALMDKGRLDEAIRHFEEAIRLAPKLAPAHYGLANALRDKGQLDKAIHHYEEAFRLDPQYAEAHCNLGGVLRQQGRFEESLAAYKRGHELGTKRPGWRFPSGQWVRDAERLAALDRKLPAILKGQAQPTDAAEQLGLADLCRLTKRYASSARFYAGAFAADPKLADDLSALHRYNAACYAALAASGQGADAPKPGDKECAHLRKQALGWLRADLALWQKQADSGQAEGRAAAQGQLRHWQNDSDLAGVRDRAALDKLPAAERDAWLRLWADVAALLQRAQEK